LDFGYFASQCIRLENDSDNNIIYNNLFHHAPINIYFMGGNDPKKTLYENVLWNNNVFSYGFWQYSWRAWIGSGIGYNGINIRSGRGNVAIGNRIHNVFNAVNVTSVEAKDDIHVNRDFDLIDNLCYNIGDDSWEPDSVRQAKRGAEMLGNFRLPRLNPDCMPSAYVLSYTAIL
jgi:hypothetical protein